MPDKLIVIVPSFRPDFKYGVSPGAPLEMMEAQEVASFLKETVVKDVEFTVFGSFNLEWSMDTIQMMWPKLPVEVVRRIPAFGPATAEEWDFLSSIDPRRAADWDTHKERLEEQGRIFRTMLNAHVLLKLGVGQAGLVVTHERLVEAAIAQYLGQWPPQEILDRGDAVVVTYPNGDGYHPKIEVTRSGL